MTMEWVTDDSGEGMWLKRLHKDRFVPKPFCADAIENMVDMHLRHDDMVHVPLRDDDVILCSYPKSDTHWVFENVRCLLSGNIMTDSVEKISSMVETFKHGHFDNHPSPRILNAHVYFDDLPSDLLKGKANVVMGYRNPKDIAVSSYYHHSKMPSIQYGGDFSNFIKRFVQGNVLYNRCYDYWKTWEEGLDQNPQIPFHLMRYEDLHMDPFGERRRLATFLGKKYDDAFLQEVAEATAIDAMKSTKGENTMKSNSAGDMVWYRKRQVGDWENHFTVSESQWFDSVTEKEMADSKFFKFVYSIE